MKKKVIDSKGHCLFCFEKFDFSSTSGSSENLQDSFKFSDVWSYVFPHPNWDHSLLSQFNFDPDPDNEKKNSNVPPMCTSCKGQLEKIWEFHEEIQSLKRRLEVLTKEAENVAQSIRDKVKGHRLDCAEYTDTLKGILVDSGVTSASMENILEFLENICKFVNDISNGDAGRTGSQSRLRSSSKRIKNERDTDSDYEPGHGTKAMKAVPPRTTPSRSKRGRKPKVIKDKEEESLTLTDLQANAKDLELSDVVKLEPEDDPLDDNLDSLNLDFDFDPDPEEDDKSEEEEEAKPKRKRKSKQKPSSTPTKRKTKSDTSASAASSSKSQSLQEKEEKERHQACEACGKTILLKDMYDHMHQHVGDYAVKCPNDKCNFMFLGRWSSKYRIHMSRSRTCRNAAGTSEDCPEKVCNVCGEQFENLVLFGYHLIRHENFEKNFPCPISNCKEVFTTKQSVEYHLRSHGFRRMKGKLFQTCSLCQEKMTPEEMELHLIEKHKNSSTDIIRCPQCPFIFLKREELLDHLAIRTHLQEGINCDLCLDDTTYHNGFRLREHYYINHQIGMKYVCSQEGCDYSTFKENVLRLHTQKVHEKKGVIYKCTVCVDPPVEYVTELALRSHNIKFHGWEPYKCRFCDNTFTAKGHLDEHEKKHLGTFQQDQPQQCNICGNVLSNRKIYKEHVRLVHTSERNFKCNLCDKTFKRIKTLKLHEKMEHLGIKHVCDTCGRAFKRQELFKQHQRIHTGERPFACELCGKTFRQRCTWKTHMKSHETKGDRFVPKGSSGRP